MAADPAVAAEVRTRTAFAFEHAPEPWHQLLFALGAIALAWWAWRRYGPAPDSRAGVVARLCRVCALVLAVAMIAGPSWRTTATTVLPARVVVAIDRSASMAREDGPDGRARIELARDLARELRAVQAERGLALTWHGLGVPGELQGDALAETAPSASGPSSALADDTITLVGERRPDLLVVLTDGRVTEGPPLTALGESLRARETQIVVLAVGGDAVEPGLWVDEVEANKEAALGETEQVRVRISARALPAGSTVIRLLVDGREVDREEIVAPEGADPVAVVPLDAVLDTTFDKQGPAKLRVVVEHGDLKDARDVAVVVAERKLRVLVLEGRPRYEARYLREAFKRDHTLEVHAYLLDGRPRPWASEGPRDHVPLGVHELKDYDAVLIGDIGPEQLPDPEGNLDALHRAVTEHGVGLVWLPGESGATARFTRHKAGRELLPVELPDEAALAGGYRAASPRRLERTGVAERQRLLDSGGVAWDELPETLGGAPLSREHVRKGADILMIDQDGAPIVVAMEANLGRTVLIAVDDTWRWRRNVGDRYLHRFHSQLLRYAAAKRRQNANAWRLLSQPARALPGELVTIQLLPARPTETGGERAVARLAGPDGREQRVELIGEEGSYSATVPAPGVGAWTLELIDGPNPAETEPGELVVLTPSSEVRDPRADRPALAELARATGGEVFTDAKALVAALPDKRQVREDVLPAQGIWDNAWVLAALVALLAIEWAIRRLNRLP